MKKSLEIPIYGRKLHLVDNWEQASRLLAKLRTKQQEFHHKHQEPEDIELPVHGGVEMAFNEIVMCVADGKIETVVHEAVHVANFTLQYAGVDAGLDNDEPIAYLTGWVFKQWQEKMDGY